MVRLFTCIWLPENQIKELEELKKELKATGIIGKFVERENLHVTICFLGEVKEGDISEVKMELDEILSETCEFHVKLEDLKLIPNENYIRVVGVKAKSVDLENLISILGKGLKVKFHKKPKLTLCRVKNVTNRTELNDFIKRNRNVKIGSFHVNKISLVKSTLTKGGPIYETIHEKVLKENEGK
ncbi:MAG: RNA 2',3'-cyclic phosphodiesterase [Candidatus Aenigmarchaeota archaeon]|nr:RNA 2',3'-cyclic phosphodiesterase [Candidatus Aenigmarchaeota archaeon]